MHVCVFVCVFMCVFVRVCVFVYSGTNNCPAPYLCIGPSSERREWHS